MLRQARLAAPALRLCRLPLGEGAAMGGAVGIGPGAVGGAGAGLSGEAQVDDFGHAPGIAPRDPSRHWG